MAFIDLYNIGYSDSFSITGTESKIKNLNLTNNPAVISSDLTGIITSNTTPVAGATINLYDINNNPIENTTTNTDGNYTFTNIPVGSYNIVAVATGFLLSNSIPVTIQENQISIANIVLVPDGTANLSAIFGMVTSNINNAPIGNATVTLSTITEDEEPKLIGTVTTTDEGQYIFANLAAGSYLISVSKQSFTLETRTITIGVRQFVPSNIILTSNSTNNTGTIGGFIFDSKTNLPISNATVALFHIKNEELIVAITKTSISGRYLFINVEPGNYRVKATLQTQG